MHKSSSTITKPKPPFYSVVAPKVVRPKSEYHIAVSTSAISVPSTIYVELSAEQDSKDVFNVSQTVTVEPNSTRIIKLEIGDVSPGKYKLECKGLSGVEFSNSADLEYSQKSHSVLIQTDRSVYKPGNKILIRAVVLDSKLCPVATGTELEVHITDGEGNRVKQWKHQMNEKGVFSGELQLSDSPVLGDWKICVKVLDLTVEKVFQVAEYVLPKFEVSVDAPKNVTFKDSSITATIEAKYTYGKPVRGEATVTASTKSFTNYFPQSLPCLIKKVVPIDGKATVNFDIASELRLENEFQTVVQLDVSVEEALTGRTQSAMTEMTLYRHKYTIELTNLGGSYKPGLKYTTFVKIAYRDGSPVQDEINPVTIRYGFNYDVSSYTKISKTLDKNGMIQLDLHPPPDSEKDTGPMTIEAEYLDLNQRLFGPEKAVSPSGTYIQALLKTDNAAVGKEVEIEIDSTVSLKYLNYEVLGRGNILEAASIRVSETKTTSFKFLATRAMAPTAYLIVYYMRDDGEIVADSLDVQVDGALQNFVNIETSPEVTQPGGNVELIISSKPNSCVGLLGVDQSSLLLKSGNDISHDQVSNELKSYDTGDKFSSPFPRWGGSPFRCSRPSHAVKLFDKTGAVLLTNGYLGEDEPRVYRMASQNAVLFGAAAPPAMPRVGRATKFCSPSFQSPPQPEKPKLRKNFPETWIWEIIDAKSDGKIVLKKTVPHTITSWVLTGFSIDPVHGFGLIEEPRKLKVFQPFFMSLNLPYSVIRGEIVAIPIVVFNYMDKDVTAEVILENEGQFDFAKSSNEDKNNLQQDSIRRERISIKAGSGTTVSFVIIPRELGQILIKATVTSSLAGDRIEQKLLVKAEGETQYRNKAIFVDLRDSNSFATNFELELPENFVSDSEYIEVSAVGDILGPSLPNLANLIKMPYGCGEQNMLNFVPNIVVINYLKSINQLTPTIHGKALNFLEAGYQRELTYRHVDGSFSAFGKSDASGSTWLTAFVVKSFIQAADHITIEDPVIKRALQWLAAEQAENGSFPEVGKVSHRDMQGGAAKGLALTAFTLIAFLQNEKYAKEYKETVSKGVDYIVDNLEELKDVYSLAICTHVLNLAKHPQEEVALKMLESKAETTTDYKWWSKPVPKNNKNPWYSLPSSVNVEMTSYAMLTYLRRNMIPESLPIMKWLVSQRNSEGGFASTQDTVIGIYALSKLGEKIASGDSDVNISFSHKGGKQSNINVNKENNVILQKHTLPKEIREVNISANGTGFAVVQVSYRYNLNTPGAFPLFKLRPEVDKSSDANNLQLSVCAGFIPTKEAEESNMAVMEVSLPSGFEVDMDSIPSLEKTEHVKRVETKNGDTVVVLYFDKMIEEEYRVKVSAFRAHKVAKQKPVPVTIYDYYDSSRRARVFYEPLASTLSDICDDGNYGEGSPAV